MILYDNNYLHKKDDFKELLVDAIKLRLLILKGLIYSSTLFTLLFSFFSLINDFSLFDLFLRNPPEASNVLDTIFSIIVFFISLYIFIASEKYSIMKYLIDKYKVIDIEYDSQNGVKIKRSEIISKSLDIDKYIGEFLYILRKSHDAYRMNIQMSYLIIYIAVVSILWFLIWKVGYIFNIYFLGIINFIVGILSLILAIHVLIVLIYLILQCIKLIGTLFNKK